MFPAHLNKINFVQEFVDVWLYVYILFFLISSFVIFSLDLLGFSWGILISGFDRIPLQYLWKLVFTYTHFPVHTHIHPSWSSHTLRNHSSFILPFFLPPLLPSIYNPSFHPTIHLPSFLPSYHPSTILPSIHNHNTELTQTKLMISDLTCIILKAWILKQLPWYPSTAPPCNI